MAQIDTGRLDATGARARWAAAAAGALGFSFAGCGEVKATLADAAPSPDIASLTIALAGGGAGVVTSSPAGINCGATCIGSFPLQTQITLTATAGTGASFAGWGGACSGSAATCVVTLTAETAVSARFTIAVPANYVFVTSTTSTGDLGGLAGADAICQARAESASLPGTYRAWLSTTTVNAISRLAGASGWIRPDGRPFANTAADVANSKLYYPARVDEHGSDVLEQLTFTATTIGGVLQNSDCAGWTSTTAAGADIGDTASSGFAWSEFGGASCNSTKRIYCFGISNAATVVPPPVTGVRRAFMMIWTPGGGIASADTACQTSAQAAGLTGSFKALLATTGASALSRFDLTGTNWYRADDIAPLGSAAAWSTATYFDTDPDLDATNTMTFGNFFNWAGASSLITAGTAASTCNDWTNQSATAQGGDANANALSTFFSAETEQCNFTSGTITCLQE